MVDIKWFLERIDELGRIGGLAAGGISRPALSRLEQQAREYVAQLMEESGMSVRVDAATNLFGRLGKPDAPVVMTGSHLDTVPQGGRYDGALGVLAGLAVARALGSLDDSPFALEVVAFAGEESSRFGLPLFGSRAFTGSLDLERLSRYVDANGIGLVDAILQAGSSMEPLRYPTMRERPAAFVELHIEQGTILKDSGYPVGAVTAIAAPTRLDVVIEGKASHSGASLPKDRKDALVAAAQVITEIELLMKREEPWQSVATVGRVRVFPNVINVVPGEVELGIDIRGSDPGSKHRLVRAIDKLLARVCAKRGLVVRRRALVDEEPVKLDERVVKIIREAAVAAGVKVQDVVSMAGHDSMELAKICPTGMIFVRNQSGISHSPAEDIAPEDIEAGCAVLYQTLKRLLRGNGIGLMP